MPKKSDTAFADADNDTLIERRGEIIGELTRGKGNALDELINDLCEIERELTLREE